MRKSAKVQFDTVQETLQSRISKISKDILSCDMATDFLKIVNANNQSRLITVCVYLFVGILLSLLAPFPILITIPIWPVILLGYLGYFLVSGIFEVLLSIALTAGAIGITGFGLYWLYKAHKENLSTN